MTESNHPNQDYPELIRGLLRANAYPHPVTDIRLLETHISWLLLTGEYAYKVKKPVNLGFLDFSSLELRQQACEQELRLNRRLSGDIYQAVVPIAGSAGQPRVRGEGDAIEYAVRMQQFDPEQGFGQLLEQGNLAQERLDELAEITAHFHEDIPRAASSQPWGEADAVIGPMRDNFAPIAKVLPEQKIRATLDPLQRWIDHQAKHLTATLATRKQNGFVRECHGDLHLDNVVLHNGHPLIFDCIEFNPALRWIDVISELAFTSMDLDHRGRPDLANRYINQYLQYSGDYHGLAVLRLYQVYRAMVRAKVEAISARQHPDDPHALERVRAYLDLARRYTRAKPPRLVITHGLSGSGKTHWTTRLLAQLDNSIRVRSDVERKRLFRLRPLDSSRSLNEGDGIYTASANTATYQRLTELSRSLLENGFSVIVEATFLWHTGRQQFRQLAGELGVTFFILDFQARDDTLMRRVSERMADGADASEADVAVLQRQIADNDPLSPQELHSVIAIDTESTPDIGRIAEQIESTHDNPEPSRSPPTSNR